MPGCNDYSTYGTGRTPRDLFQIMKDQFDYLYWEGEQGSPKYFAFNLHPFLSGVPFRTIIVDEFIKYAKGHPSVFPSNSVPMKFLVPPLRAFAWALAEALSTIAQ